MARVHYTHLLGVRSLSGFDFAARIARRIRERRQMNALLKMDNYQLKDIGLTLSDIQRDAAKSIWRD